MESQEFTGETVDEAIAAGIEQLGVSPGDVLVEVLEEPSRGVFGIGARPARVRLQLIRRPAPPPPPPTDATPEAEPVAAADAVAEGDIDPDDDGQVARQVLLELLDHMEIRGDVAVRRAEADNDDEDPPWLLDVTGMDAELLIGRRGETLASLQYITRLITSRRLERRANIIIDADGYKSQRTDRLKQLAVRMADEAVRIQRTVDLEPMPPNERRIIHMTLRDREDVETRSAGEGSARKVTIVPL
jgi:spoIIIJ-associated protein